MNAYLIVAGLFFSIVTITHGIRAFVEEGVLRSANFVVSTIFAVFMAIWAFWLVRRQRAAVARPNEELKPTATPKQFG